VDDRRRLEIVVGTIIVSSLWPIGKGLQQLVTGTYNASASGTAYAPRSNYNAIESIFTHPNPFGFYLVLILLLALVAMFEVRRPLLRVPLALVLLTGGICLLNTYGRAAWLAFAVAVLLLGAWRYRVLLIAGLIMLPLAGFAAPDAVREVSKRFGDLTSSSAAHQNNSWDWRQEQWRRMRRYGEEKPITGQGFGSYQRLTLEEFGIQDRRFRTAVGPALQPIGFTAHNDYVKTYVEMGWPGLILWLAVLLGLVVALVRAARAPGVAPWAIGLAAVGVVVMGLSYSDNLQAGYSVVFVSLFAAAAGAAVGAARGSSEQQPAG
jgi:O-antigen ligase